MVLASLCRAFPKRSVFSTAGVTGVTSEQQDFHSEDENVNSAVGRRWPLSRSTYHRI